MNKKKNEHMFWSFLVTGLFFSVLAVVIVPFHAIKVEDSPMGLSWLPALIFDFLNRPLGFLGVFLLMIALILKRGHRLSSGKKKI